jgi:hypothetical protein
MEECEMASSLRLGYHDVFKLDWFFNNNTKYISIYHVLQL